MKEYQLVEHIGVISVDDKNMSLELNIIKWNDDPICLDIRKWSADRRSWESGVTYPISQIGVLADKVTLLADWCDKKYATV